MKYEYMTLIILDICKEASTRQHWLSAVVFVHSEFSDSEEVDVWILQIWIVFYTESIQISMPRVYVVKTLQELCVENVARNIEKWCKIYVDHGKKKLDRLDVIGPFNLLRKYIHSK